MEEVAAPAPDPRLLCGAPGPPPEAPKDLESPSASEDSSEARVAPGDEGNSPETFGGPSEAEACSNPEGPSSLPDGLLPLMAAVGVIDAEEAEQARPPAADVAAAAAAAEGAERLLEHLFSPNPAQKLAESNPDDLRLLKQQDVRDLLLWHAIRAEHEDRETLQLLELLMLQPLQQEEHQQKVTADPRATVKQQLIDQLLLPHQQEQQQLPVECLCGLPIEGGFFSCSNSSSRTEAATSPTKATSCCVISPSFSLRAVSQALFSCCCQGKLRCFLLLERCCSVVAADKLLLQQGRGSLMHAAAMGGSRAVLQRLVAAHGLSPRGAPDSANYNEPIHLAACCGRTSAVLLLLELGVPIEAPDRFRRTPAFHAAANGHVLLLRALAAMGANLNVLDADGLSLLQEATARRRIRDGRPREEVVDFLLENNAGNRPKRDRD